MEKIELKKLKHSLPMIWNSPHAYDCVECSSGIILFAWTFVLLLTGWTEQWSCSQHEPRTWKERKNRVPVTANNNTTPSNGPTNYRVRWWHCTLSTHCWTYGQITMDNNVYDSLTPHARWLIVETISRQVCCRSIVDETPVTLSYGDHVNFVNGSSSKTFLYRSLLFSPNDILLIDCIIVVSLTYQWN
jgi:hypothetical protein